MGIQVEAGLQRRQELGGSQLALGNRFGHALLGQANLRVLHAGQLQRRGEVDRLRVLRQDGNWRGEGDLPVLARLLLCRRFLPEGWVGESYASEQSQDRSLD